VDRVHSIPLVFDYSLVESIPDIPQDSTHWWGTDTSFFASRLGKNLFTVVGGVQDDPNNPFALYKNASWDQGANTKILSYIYSVSNAKFITATYRN
jgi:salicylate hydroxylase